VLVLRFRDRFIRLNASLRPIFRFDFEAMESFLGHRLEGMSQWIRCRRLTSCLRKRAGYVMVTNTEGEHL
jgi:hypothetical protein